MSISLLTPLSVKAHVGFALDEVCARMPCAFGAFSAQIARNSYECQLTNDM